MPEGGEFGGRKAESRIQDRRVGCGFFLQWDLLLQVGGEKAESGKPRAESRNDEEDGGNKVKPKAESRKEDR